MISSIPLVSATDIITFHCCVFCHPVEWSFDVGPHSTPWWLHHV